MCFRHAQLSRRFSHKRYIFWASFTSQYEAAEKKNHRHKRDGNSEWHKTTAITNKSNAIKRFKKHNASDGSLEGRRKNILQAQNSVPFSLTVNGLWRGLKHTGPCHESENWTSRGEKVVGSERRGMCRRETLVGALDQVISWVGAKHYKKNALEIKQRWNQTKVIKTGSDVNGRVEGDIA